MKGTFLTSSDLNVATEDSPDRITGDTSVCCTVDVLPVSCSRKRKEDEGAITEYPSDTGNVADWKTVDSRPVNVGLRAASSRAVKPGATRI